MISLLYEYSNLEYIRIYVIYRVTEAAYVICIRMTAPREYVNTYSTRRVSTFDRLLDPPPPPPAAWPLQDIRLFIWGLCTGQYCSRHSTPPPPRCIVQSILRNIRPPSDPPCVCLHSNIV